MCSNGFREPGVAFLPPVLGASILLALACISLLKGRKNAVTCLFALLCLLGTLINLDIAQVSILADKGLALKLDRAAYLLFLFSVPLYLRFVHAFLGIRNRRKLELAGFAFSVLLVPFTQGGNFIRGFNEYSFGVIADAGPLYLLFIGGGAITVLYCVFILLRTMEETPDSLFRNRIRYILVGMGGMSFMILMNSLPIAGYNIYPMGNFSFIPGIILAVGIFKYDLLDMGAVIRKGSVYIILTGSLTVLYICALYAFNRFSLGFAGGDPLVVPLIVSVAVVLIFNPLRAVVQRFVDTLFFPGRYDYRATLREISRVMTSLLRMEEIAAYLMRSIRSSMGIGKVFLLFSDRGAAMVVSYPSGYCRTDATGPTSWRRVSEYFRREPAALTTAGLERKKATPEEHQSLADLFTKTGATLLVPVLSGDVPIGVIGLSQKESGEMYVPEDIELLTTIANQTAIALENARRYEEIEAMNTHLEEKVKERTRELMNALAEKERTQQQLIRSESLAAIGQLVAGAAHELNNPLASASSLVETTAEMLDELSSSDDRFTEARDDLDFSLKELSRAGEIVKSLLGVSRQTDTYEEPVHMNRVVDDALRVLGNRCRKEDVAVVRELDETIPCIMGNFSNLGRVFINIIGNAIDALPRPGGTILLRTAYDGSRKEIRIECRDTGRGIPQDIMQEMFKPFFTTKEPGAGTGLGLYLSHEIVKRHGGDIQVLSETGKGAVVTVTLPVERRTYDGTSDCR
ncbi:MAG: GAF domain-containing protein [Deltaproteobacteria bacterium]|nr:GAF domain-containing protein [Deltaproteobacteria bacterium]